MSERATVARVPYLHALDLTERRERLASLEPHTFGRSNDVEDLLQSWMAPLGNAEERLQADGLTLEVLRSLLHVPAESFGTAGMCPPWWATRWAEAFEGPTASVLLDPGALKDNPGIGFLYVVEPLVRLYEGGLRTGVESLAARGVRLTFDAGQAWTLFSATLLLRLQVIVSKTMVLELNVARLAEELSGSTSDERFLSFVTQLRDRHRQHEILEEYPVLARRVIECLEAWLSASLELIERLGADGEHLQSLCGGRDPGALIHIRPDAGDRHRGGRSVTVLEFESGWRVVYKPRSLATDVSFNRLVAWANSRGFKPTLKTVRVVDRGAYGWAEFVDAADCESEDGVSRFYERTGAFLALLYALEASDFHYENIIAQGEHPVPIDFECLFTPLWKEEAALRPGASFMLERSVLRTGLLPRRLYLRPDAEGFDVGGMVASGGEMTPVGVSVFTAQGTDEMHVVREQVPLKEGKNRPRLAGQEVVLTDHAEAVVEGFTRMYSLIMAERRAMLDDGGALSWFASHEVRVLLRMTGAYTHLLAQSHHPDLLRDGLSQERHWDVLWNADITAPEARPLVAAERRAAMRGDVPMFTTRAGSRDLNWSDTEGIPDYFARSGLEMARERIALMSPEDCARQAWVIRASLATAREKHAPVRHVAVSRPSEAKHADFIRHAVLVGERLATTAIRHDGEATWLGLRMTGDDHFSVLPMGTDLYSGLPGQALFLAHLGAQTGEGRFTELAREATSGLVRLSREASPVTAALGAFAGTGGVLYTLAHLAALWRDGDLVTEAETIAQKLQPTIEKDRQLDVVYGAAGCIPGLLALSRSAGSTTALRLATRCGEHLLGTARQRGDGLAWELPRGGALAGFAHGAGGIAWALMELHREVGDSRLLSVARRALAFDRAVLRIQADAREGGMAATAAAEPRWFAWCKGVSGTGLGRLRLADHMDDATFGSEIDEALASTAAHGFDVNHSLCHGDMGNLELFLETGRRRLGSSWTDRGRQLASRTIGSIEARGWLCGVPTGVETPGLMVGITGIGYGCLRLAAPETVPSVLLLESPKPWR